MIKHIVLWELKEEAKGEKLENTITLLQGKFKPLIGVVDGLVAIEVGSNYNGGKFDVALYCEFTSQEAQEAYQGHPEHLKIKEVVHSLVCDRTSIDYEI
ncbi:Dabb family protein [Clostridium vincentii]|uniref:Stress responsive A/B Barrel Domain protein n=1 Tax=Clostridium vincentii TaxID=52704 RepID=A0A2T0BBR2_9CLOT|nr:Dabb family protein [Clostridium vincentii]PRR81247.1 Stress responsive A/B Barrel Domain protein [Clostridium vincentii]